jgi:FHS family L-fucose permease-like MFS transporter
MHARNSRIRPARYVAAFVLTVSLFALWGLGQRVYDTLLPQFAKVFDLRSYELALTQSIYSIAYFLGAIPAALCARRFGYKAAILFGLGSIGVGAYVLYPAAETHVFPYFLLAVTVMSCGWIFLEVAANPLAASIGRAKASVRTLNLAQAFFPIGAIAGIYIGRWIVRSNLALPAERFTHSIVHPYILMGCCVLVLAYLIDSASFPGVASERTRGFRNVAGEFRTLLTRPLFVFGVVTQVFSVLALAGTWTLCGRFTDAAFLGPVFILSMAAFAAGRFVGFALMYVTTPERLLAAFAGAGLLLSAVAAGTAGPIAGIAMVASSFFLSITWPTVLGISIRGLGPLMKLATALVCMGGALGGFAYQMIAVMWKFPSVHMAMLIPALSYAVILAFALASARTQRTPAVTRADAAVSAE